ncbi:probable long-chain-alcohol O-fatty-acyltransferase 5 [Actinidia eriantha]|uniref:probable long-chain-alcohol O-fatty-acyltransferase 5 n=1 Tax=Actinidia eriantha TaxID=165200 RepID=UPI002590EAC8|nr:probable long-chain-alcohol O-fatty-acyltransferase 5 [Actinidia eriantha]
MTEINSLIKIWMSSIGAMCYSYFIARHIPRGLPRLLSLLPIFSLFVLLPLNLHTAHFSGTIAFYLVWLANFKLLLFSFDQGPLSYTNSPLQFIYTALLPIKIKQEPPPNPKINKNPPPKSSSNPLLLPVKVLLFAIVIYSYKYMQLLHPYLIWVLHCCNIYLSLELLLATIAFLARAILGLELEPQFNEPYLATSLQDFWGRRWNLVVSSILRPTVYKPIWSISMGLVGRTWAPLPAIVASFLVSGLMHEVIFFYLTRARPTWEVMWFFVLHGVCTAAEVAVKKAVGNRWRLHRVVSGPLTVGFVAVTGVWLFFPQLTRNGIDQRSIEEFSNLVDFARVSLQKTISLGSG